MVYLGWWGRKRRRIERDLNGAAVDDIARGVVLRAGEGFGFDGMTIQEEVEWEGEGDGGQGQISSTGAAQRVAVEGGEEALE